MRSGFARQCRPAEGASSNASCLIVLARCHHLAARFWLPPAAGLRMVPVAVTVMVLVPDPAADTAPVPVRAMVPVHVVIMGLVMVRVPAVVTVRTAVSAGDILRPMARFPRRGRQTRHRRLQHGRACKCVLPKRRLPTLVHRNPKLRQTRQRRSRHHRHQRGLLPHLPPMNDWQMLAHCGRRFRRQIIGRRFLICRLCLVGGVFVLMMYFSQHAMAESTTDCVNRCQTICGYFPDNPECQRQSDRCVLRCRHAKGN